MNNKNTTTIEMFILESGIEKEKLYNFQHNIMLFKYALQTQRLSKNIFLGQFYENMCVEYKNYNFREKFKTKEDFFISIKEYNIRAGRVLKYNQKMSIKECFLYFMNKTAQFLLYMIFLFLAFSIIGLTSWIMNTIPKIPNIAKSLTYSFETMILGLVIANFISYMKEGRRRIKEEGFRKLFEMHYEILDKASIILECKDEKDSDLFWCLNKIHQTVFFYSKWYHTRWSFYLGNQVERSIIQLEKDIKKILNNFQFLSESGILKKKTVLEFLFLSNEYIKMF